MNDSIEEILKDAADMTPAEYCVKHGCLGRVGTTVQDMAVHIVGRTVAVMRKAQDWRDHVGGFAIGDRIKTSSGTIGTVTAYGIGGSAVPCLVLTTDEGKLTLCPVKEATVMKVPTYDEVTQAIRDAIQRAADGYFEEGDADAKASELMAMAREAFENRP